MFVNLLPQAKALSAIETGLPTTKQEGIPTDSFYRIKV
jgi:hypothetical protein